MIKIWDKKESINGVLAEDFLKDNPLIHDGDEVVLYCNELGIPNLVINVTTERVNLKLDSSLDAIQVAEAYLNELEKQNNIVNQVAVTNSDTNSSNLENRVSDLESYVLEKEADNTISL